MSNFITKQDFLPKITDGRITQLIDNNNTLLDDAEATAIVVIRDALYDVYDVDAIFSKTGAARDKQVVRWVSNLALYYLYERRGANQVPELAIENYNETIELLRALESGRRSVQLPRKTNSNGDPTAQIRYGSRPKRTH